MKEFENCHSLTEFASGEEEEAEEGGEATLLVPIKLQRQVTGRIDAKCFNRSPPAFQVTTADYQLACLFLCSFFFSNPTGSVSLMNSYLEGGGGGGGGGGGEWIGHQGGPIADSTEPIDIRRGFAGRFPPICLSLSFPFSLSLSLTSDLS